MKTAYQNELNAIVRAIADTGLVTKIKVAGQNTSTQDKASMKKQLDIE